MSENILKLEHASIGFERTIFENINAQLKVGTLTCLMGVNGVGKSCLLKTMARLQKAKAGNLFIEEEEISKISIESFAKKVGIVLTEKFLIDYLTVYELVSFGRVPYTNRLGQLNDTDHEIIEKVIRQTGIWDLKDHYVSRLSDGQRQKAFIARALAQNPQVLILDEPTTYLDIPSKVELIQLLAKIARAEKIAVVMSTHDLDLIEKQADQIWLMSRDRKFYSGSPEELRSSGLIAKNFFTAELK